MAIKRKALIDYRKILFLSKNIRNLKKKNIQDDDFLFIFKSVSTIVIYKISSRGESRS